MINWNTNISPPNECVGEGSYNFCKSVLQVTFCDTDQQQSYTCFCDLWSVQICDFLTPQWKPIYTFNRHRATLALTSWPCPPNECRFNIHLLLFSVFGLFWLLREISGTSADKLLYFEYHATFDGHVLCSSLSGLLHCKQLPAGHDISKIEKIKPRQDQKT